jgi:hypothetical protein
MSTWVKLPSGTLIDIETLIYVKPEGDSKLKLIWATRNVEICEYEDGMKMDEDLKYIESIFLDDSKKVDKNLILS